MNLTEKIEEIKRKPEHIRLRYVWFFVAISMILVVAIWIFSIKISVNPGASDATLLNEFNNASNQFDDQKQTLQSVLENSQESVNDSFTGDEIQNNTENEPVSNNNVNISKDSEISEDTETIPNESVAPNLFPVE